MRPGCAWSFWVSVLFCKREGVCGSHGKEAEESLKRLVKQVGWVTRVASHYTCAHALQ